MIFIWLCFLSALPCKADMVLLLDDLCQDLDVGSHFSWSFWTVAFSIFYHGIILKWDIVLQWFHSFLSMRSIYSSGDEKSAQ